MAKNDLEKIVWPSRQDHVPEEVWDTGLAGCIRIIGMEGVRVQEWHDRDVWGGEGYFPSRLEIEKVLVTCFPWEDGYVMEGLFRMPFHRNDDSFRSAIRAMKVIKNIAHASRETEQTLRSLLQLLNSGLTPEGINLIIGPLSDLKDLRS